MVKKKAKKTISPNQKKKLQSALNGLEQKLVTNYKNVAGMSRNDWRKQSKTYHAKVKKQVAAARRKVEAHVRKNPAQATLAAAILGAVAGAVIMSKLRKR